MTDRTEGAAMPANNRSAVTNGARAFLTPGGEQTAIGRRWRDIYAEICSDRGGADQLSEGERQLARRAATLSIEAETMEAARAEGGGLDLEGYIALTNGLGRALARLGLKRIPRDVTPKTSVRDRIMSGGAIDA